MWPKSAQGVAVLHWTGVKIVNRTHDPAVQTGTTLLAIRDWQPTQLGSNLVRNRKQPLG